MRAGILKDRIDIYRQVTTQSEYGELSTEYQKYKTYRANVENKLGNRGVENHEIVYDYSKTFRLRYYVDVQDKDRIEYNGNKYRVISILKDKDFQQTTILAELINE